MQNSVPKYQEVAVDFAAKLVEGKLREGDRVYARSALASQYGVSSETARRAICVLSDLGVVEVTKGSGVVIRSLDRAVAFLRQFNEVSSLEKLKEEIRGSLARQREEIDRLSARLEEVYDRAEKMRAENPLAPFRVQLEGRCVRLGKTLRDLNFWHLTMATVVAIRSGDSMCVSPGPFFTLKEGDILYFVGGPGVVERVHRFLYETEDGAGDPRAEE